MRILDRYVIRQLLMPFGIGLLVFTFLFIIPEFMRYAEDYIAKGAPMSAVAQVIVALLPMALGLTIPMSLLMALLVAFGRLSADREFVALQACGVSPRRLLRPGRPGLGAVLRRHRLRAARLGSGRQSALSRDHVQHHRLAGRR